MLLPVAGQPRWCSCSSSWTAALVLLQLLALLCCCPSAASPNPGFHAAPRRETWCAARCAQQCTMQTVWACPARQRGTSTAPAAAAPPAAPAAAVSRGAGKGVGLLPSVHAALQLARWYATVSCCCCCCCCMPAYMFADASLLCHQPWQPWSPPRLQTFAALSPPVLRAEGIVPTGCQWVDCQAFVGPDTLQQQPRPFAGTSSGGSGVKPEPAAAAGEAAAAVGGPEPMQVDGAGAPGTADFSRIIAAASSKVLQGGVPAEASAAAPAAQAAALEAPGGAAVHCPVTGRWSHLGCFPAQFTEQLRHTAYTQPCISTQPAAESSERLAAVCAAGLLPLGSIAEGARAAGGSGAAEGGGSGSGFAPLPLSLLVVRGAAVAAPADCRGHSPAYAPEQRRQLQVALSAALQVLHRWAAPLIVQLACPSLHASRPSPEHQGCCMQHAAMHPAHTY